MSFTVLFAIVCITMASTHAFRSKSMLLTCGEYWTSLYTRQCRSFSKQYSSTVTDHSDQSSEEEVSPNKVFNLSRIYIPSKLSVDQEVKFSDEDVNYVRNVMRMNTGESLRVFNEQDGEFLAQISVIKERRFIKVFAKVVSLLRKPVYSNKPEVCLVFAPIKRDRMKIMVEKATELGISILQPVITQNTNHDLDKAESLQKVIMQSVEQSERLVPPLLL
ncbi:RsmE family RNA methyltransferase, partial [archaeon]